MATSGKKAGSIPVHESSNPSNSNEVAPLCQKSIGSFTPQFPWLLYAAIKMAPYCRKFTVDATEEIEEAQEVSTDHDHGRF
jgi:hypothetical protein